MVAELASASFLVARSVTRYLPAFVTFTVALPLRATVNCLTCVQRNVLVLSRSTLALPPALGVTVTDRLSFTFGVFLATTFGATGMASVGLTSVPATVRSSALAVSLGVVNV